MIGIVDYGCGNVGSVANMVNRLGYKARAIHDVNSLNKATFIILPGVGHFAYGMTQLNLLSYKDSLINKINVEGVPTLGICMGMQLLSSHSEEGDCSGLGCFDLKTLKFPASGPLPHMGWSIVDANGKLDVRRKSRFYFSHRYFVEFSKKYTSYTSEYNGIKFSAAIEHNNIMGCQFHPEKSHKFGMEFFEGVLSKSYE